MKTLSVDASSNEVAQSLYAALAGFQPEVLEKPEGGWQVVVPLQGGDAQVVGILSALQRYVSERANGPARVELSGHSYTLHAEQHGDHTSSQTNKR